jgi:glutamate-1-semialdehyde aminotransferase/malonyl CoA-acyl carrier protein transacylase/acyl carrier protein
MFPGQGTQYPGMGAGLYSSEPVYRRHVDHCLEILQPLLGTTIREVLFPGKLYAESAAERLKDTAYAQPAIFLTEYSLARLWQHRGIVPDAMIGHSIGEFVAAALADVFSLEDALRLVVLRGRLMQEQPPGSMLSVRASSDVLRDRLPPDVALACVNGPELCVVSGPTDTISGVQRELEGEGLTCRILHTSHAFHSAMMDPVVEPFLAEIQKIHLNPPNRRIMSTVTAQWLTDAQSTNAAYWARHLRETVRFADGVRQLLEGDARVFFECGARTTLSTLARQQFPKDKNIIAIAALGEDGAPEAERIACLRAAGELWASGVELDWTATDPIAPEARKVALPGYQFERKRFWVDPAPAVVTPLHQTTRAADPVSGTEVEKVERIMATTVSRADNLVGLVMSLLNETSGMDLGDTDPSMSFLEMGFDSLFLTQVSGKLGKQTGIAISFRQMLEDYPSPRELADHLDGVLPPEVLQPAAAAPAPIASERLALPPATLVAAGSPDVTGTDAVRRLLTEQLEVMRQQLVLVAGLGQGVAPPPVPKAVVKPAAPAPVQADGENARSFGPSARINRSRVEPLRAEQNAFIKDLIARYTSRTAKSKASTQSNRRVLADPRTVSGFHPLWKEMIYPIVSTGSSGCKIFDVDGNEYIDVTNGFGTILFGHSPDFVVDAIERQLKAGYETGPQSELAGKAAALVSELTGHERVAFTNTGSEAVLAAMRIARTCTGKQRIAIFAGSYHGIFDEVLVRGSGNGHGGIPAAPGIPSSATDNILVLEYGAEESLRIIEAESDSLAAVLVESIQGGNPAYRPVEFLRSLRELTHRSGVTLIFDEVVTGFRVHPAGAQGLFGIKADIASYGKVAGGGMPIGIVAGSAKFMDALDGGYWQFGDESRPEANMTFFAGTFVRHPLALAASVAVLERLKQCGGALQETLNERAGRFAERLNRLFSESQVPMKLNYFSSFGRIASDQDLKYAGLLYFLLREKGVHIWEGRAVILTTAHGDAELDAVITAFAESIEELQSVGLLPAAAHAQDAHVTQTRSASGNGAPVPGAQLGRTPEGFPAWFIADPERPGKYIQVGEPTAAA